MERLATSTMQRGNRRSKSKAPSSSSAASSLPSGRVPLVVMAFVSCLAWLYVAGRLWQDAQSRAILSGLLEKSSAGSVRIALSLPKCKEIGSKIVEAEMDLSKAKSEGYLLWGNSSRNAAVDSDKKKKQLLAVIGVYTGFGSRLERNAFRGSWMPRGDALKKLEEEGVVVRFVIGRSANRGDSLDRNIDDENQQTKDFLLLESHEEVVEELPSKVKFFFSAAVETWDAEFYVKVEDNVNLNLAGLIEMLKGRRGSQGLYMGCMKSGVVISEERFAKIKSKAPNLKIVYKGGNNIHRGEEYEPEWWKFGDSKTYFQHASGSLFILSKNLARYININSASLQIYAHDEISVGSWMMGLNATYVDDDRLCCSSSRQEKVCSKSTSSLGKKRIKGSRKRTEEIGRPLSSVSE